MDQGDCVDRCPQIALLDQLPGPLRLVEKAIIENHGRLGSRILRLQQHLLPLPEILLSHPGLSLPRRQRFLEEQPPGPERQQSPARFQPLLLARQDHDRIRLRLEQLLQGARVPCATFLRHLPRLLGCARVAGDRHILVPQQAGQIVLPRHVARAHDGDFHALSPVPGNRSSEDATACEKYATLFRPTNPPCRLRLADRIIHVHRPCSLPPTHPKPPFGKYRQTRRKP